MTTWRPKSFELLAGLAGFAIVLLMFGVNWYELDAPGESSLGGFDAWQAFSALDILLFATGALGVALAVRSIGGSAPRMLGAITAAVAAIATVLLVVRISNPPTFDSTLGHLELARGAGAYAGLVAVALLALAAALAALRRRGLTS